MSARHLTVALVLAVAAPPLLAEEARRRDEGRSAPAVDRADRSRAESTYRPRASGDTSFSSRAPSSSEGDRAVPRTDAQRRHPRPGTGTGSRYYGGRHRGYGYYPYYRSYYRHYPYYPYWGYWGYGYGWPYAGYYYGGYYPYRYYRDDGSIRVLVEPRDTRVFVDGYYAGVADDFDGVFQRLHVSPGRHEITLKLEGFRTHRLRVYVAADSTLKLRHRMVTGAGEETFEDLAGGVEPDEDRYRYGRTEREETGLPGRLRLEIRPEDASVYVDGRFWGSARGDAELELPPGRHRVEVVRPGFRTEERDVEVESGRTERLEVELERP